MEMRFFGFLVLTVVLLSSCGKAPNTVKVLEGMNNEVALQWASTVKKQGVNYAEHDGSTILGFALTANNPTLVTAILKDGGDPNKPIHNQFGQEQYPLTFVLFANMPANIPQDNYPTIKALLDGGASLDIYNKEYINIPFECIIDAHDGPTEPVFDMVLPYYTKSMLNFTGDLPEKQAKQIASYVDLTAYFSSPGSDNLESMERMLKQLVDKGLKLRQSVVQAALEENPLHSQTVSDLLISACQ
jgi:hypothetical protein